MYRIRVISSNKFQITHNRKVCQIRASKLANKNYCEFALIDQMIETLHLTVLHFSNIQNTFHYYFLTIFLVSIAPSIFIL